MWSGGKNDAKRENDCSKIDWLETNYMDFFKKSYRKRELIMEIRTKNNQALWHQNPRVCVENMQMAGLSKDENDSLRRYLKTFKNSRIFT